MKSKTPYQPLSLLFPLIAGAVTCTGCIPPHMETPTATGHKTAPKQAVPDKMHTLLEQPDMAITGAEQDSPIKPTSLAPETVCQALTDCPKDEPDTAAIQAKEFEQQFLHRPEQHKHKSIRKQRSPTTSSSSQPITSSRKKELAKPKQEISALAPYPRPEDRNRLLAYVDIGTRVFIQTDQDGSLQAINTVLVDKVTDGLMFAQQLSAPHTLEVIQDGSSHAIQALNYVGADFST